MDLIVQKVKKSNQDKQQVSQMPERANEQAGTHKNITNSQPSNTSKEPIREPTQKDSNYDKTQPKRDDMTIMTITDSPHSKSTILLESSDDDHPTTNAPLLAPIQLQAVAESTRIFQQPSFQQSPLTMEQDCSEDEYPAHKDDIPHASPASAYSTVPSEIPPTATRNFSPISSLATDDIECLNQIFDC